MSSSWGILEMTTSGRAAKTSVARGTETDLRYVVPKQMATVAVLRTLKALHGLNTTDVLAALPLVVVSEFVTY